MYHDHLWKVVAQHWIVCRTVDAAWDYCKRAVLRFCDDLAREFLTVLFEPVARFLAIALTVTVSSLAITALLTFGGATPHRRG